MFARGLAMQPLLDDTGIQYDARKFNWIGSLTSDVSMVLSWHTGRSRPSTTLRQREMIVAGTGSGADSVIFPYILNGVLGTKFKVVTGYPGATDFLLAVERGEADGTAGVSWSSITAGTAGMDREQADQRAWCSSALKKHPDMGAAPLVMEYRQDRFRPRRAGTDLRAAGHGLSGGRAARRAGRSASRCCARRSRR